MKNFKYEYNVLAGCNVATLKSVMSYLRADYTFDDDYILGIYREYLGVCMATMQRGFCSFTDETSFVGGLVENWADNCGLEYISGDYHDVVFDDSKCKPA